MFYREEHLQKFVDAVIKLQAPEIALLRKGDTCARMCEGTAFRHEAQRLKAENATLRAIEAQKDLELAKANNWLVKTEEVLEKVKAEIIALRGREMMLRNKLEIARNGIQWYAENSPLASNCDEEALDTINEALTASAEAVATYKQQVIDEAFGEPVAWMDENNGVIFTLLPDFMKEQRTPLYRKPEVSNV